MSNAGRFAGTLNELIESFVVLISMLCGRPRRLGLVSLLWLVLEASEAVERRAMPLARDGRALDTRTDIGGTIVECARSCEVAQTETWTL